MRVLFSVPRYHPNYDGMVKGLKAANHDVAFLVHRNLVGEQYFPGVNVQVIERSWLSRLIIGNRQSKINRFRTLPSLRTLRKALSFAPDVIIARELSLTNYLLFLVCHFRQTSYLAYVQHSDDFVTEDPGGAVPSRYRRRAISLLARVGLWPRHTIKTTLKPADLGWRTYDFVPFAIDHQGYVKEQYPNEHPVRLIAVGKLDLPRKNNAELVKAIAPELRAGRAVLTIIGLRNPEVTPTYQRLLDTISEEGVGDSVTVLENLDYHVVRQHYCKNDVFVMPNSGEVAGISPIEAMATGLSVVFTSANGTNYFCEEGDTGLIFTNRDFVDLREKVSHFLDNLPEIERMGRRGREVIASRYSPAEFARRIEATIAKYYPNHAVRLGLTSSIARTDESSAIAFERVPPSSGNEH